MTGEQLRAWRERRGWTLREATAATGYDYSNWRKLERGSVTLREDATLYRLLAALDEIDRLRAGLAENPAPDYPDCGSPVRA